MADAVSINIELPVPRPILIDAPDNATFALGNDPYFGGAAGDGVADDRPAFVKITTDLPAGTELLVSRGAYRIGTSLTLSNPVRFEGGGRFVIPDGVTLTLAGGIVAPPFRIFECIGTGKVVLSERTKAIHPEWWGGSWDGVGSDTEALKAALLVSAACEGAVMVPATTRHGALSIPAKASYIGVENKTRVVAESGNYNLFTITGSDASVHNVEIEAAAKTGGYEFVIDTGSGNTVERWSIENVLGWDSRGGVRDLGTGIHITSNFKQVQFRRHNGPGVHFTRAFAFHWPEKVAIDYVGVSTSDYTAFFCDFGGIATPGAGGIFFRDCDALGTCGQFNLPNQRGFDIRNAAAVGLYQTRADTLGEKGVVLKNVNKLVLDDAEIGLCAGHAIELENVNNASGDVLAYGRKGLPYAPPNADGLHLIGGCADIDVKLVARDFTRHGVNKAANQSGSVTLSPLNASFNGGRGISSSGDSPLLAMGKLQGNLEGDYTLGGANDYFIGMVNSGALLVAGKNGTDNLSAFGLKGPLIFGGTAYTLNSNDLGAFIRFSAANAITVTIPPNSVQPFPIGGEVEIEKAAAGNITIAAGAGVDIGSANGLTITTQFQSRRLKKVGNDAWLVL